MSRFSMDWSELSLQVMITFGHFLWQACVVGVVLLVVQHVAESLRDSRSLLRLRRGNVRLGETDLRGANIRYTIACVAFVSLPFCVVATFAWVHQSRGPIMLVASDPVESPSSPMATAFEAIPTMANSDIPVQPPLATPMNPEVPVTEPIEPPTLVEEPQTSRAQHIQAFAPYLLLAYIVGVGFMLARFSMSIIGSSRLRRTIRPITDVKLLRTIAEQCVRVGLKRIPIVALCQRVSVPVVVGIVKPMILLPPALLCGLDPNQIAAILSHEIAHIRRYDLIVNFLQRIVEALLFFHPVTWWISRRVSIERENCCDDVAAACVGRLPYAGALLQMAELCIGNDRRRSAALATLSASGSNSTDLGYRIRRLIGAEETTRVGFTRRSISIGLAMLSLLAVSLVAWGQHQRSEDKESAAEAMQTIFTPAPLWQTKLAADDAASEMFRISPIVVAANRVLSIEKDFDLGTGKEVESTFVRLPRKNVLDMTLDPIFRRKSSDRNFLVEVSVHGLGKISGLDNGWGLSPCDIRVLRATDGRQVGTTIHVNHFFDGITSDVDVENSSDFLVLGVGNEVQVYRTETGEVETTMPVKTKRVDAVAISPDLEWLVVSDQNDLHFWRWRDQAPVKTIHVGRKIDSLVFTPDGQYLAEGPDTREDIQIRDMRTLEIFASLKDEVASPLMVSSMDITPDGRYLVAHNEVSVDPEMLTIPHRIHVWDLQSRGKPVFQIATGEWVRKVEFSDDGQMIVGEFSGAAHGAVLAAWQLPNEIVQRPIDSPIDAKDRLGDGIQWSRFGDENGLLSGARLTLPQDGLKPGEPLVVEYRLANVSKETKTLKCYLNKGMQFTSLGHGNRISGFGLDRERELVTLTIEPGEVFIDTEHLVSIDTTGLEPGEYHAALGSAFFYPDSVEPNTTHELPHRGSIPFTIVGESAGKVLELPKSDIHWGQPIAGLQVGARFAGDPTAYAIGATIEADLFVANVTDHPIECSVALPHPRDGWLFNVEDSNGSTIMLQRSMTESSPFPQEYVQLKLAPGEVTVLTKDQDKKDGTPSRPRPKFELADKETAEQGWSDYTIKGRLVTQGGTYSAIFDIVIIRPEIPALRLELDTGNVRFTVLNTNENGLVVKDAENPRDGIQQAVIQALQNSEIELGSNPIAPSVLPNFPRKLKAIPEQVLVIDAIFSLLSDPPAELDIDERRNALRYLIFESPDRLTTLLIERLTTQKLLFPDTTGIAVPYYEIDALGQIGEAASDSIPVLTKFLNAEQPEVRGTAIEALIRVGPRSSQVMQSIATKFDDPHKVVRGLAVYQVGRYGKLANPLGPKFTELLNADTKKVQCWAAAALITSEFNPELGFKKLLESSQAGSIADRKLALSSLAMLGSRAESILSQLRTMIDDRNSELAKEVRETIRRIETNDRNFTHAEEADKQTADRKAAAVKTENPGDVSIQEHKPVNFLGTDLKDEDVAAFVDKTLTKPYRPKLGGGSWQLGAHDYSIILTLASIPQQEMVADALMKRIEFSHGSSDIHARKLAMDYCAQNFPDRLLPYLVRRLSATDFPEPDLSILGQAFPSYSELTVLGDFGEQGKVAIPALMKHLSAGDPIAREATIRSLVRVGPSDPEVMQSLSKCFNDSNVRVQGTAVYQAGRYGELSKPLGPKFVELLEAKSKEVQFWAAAALITSKFNPDLGFERLLAGAKAGERKDRRQALTTLAMLGSRSAAITPDLRSMLNDSDPKVVREVRETIRRIETNDRIVTHAEEAAKKAAARELVSVVAENPANRQTAGALKGRVTFDGVVPLLPKLRVPPPKSPRLTKRPTDEELRKFEASLVEIDDESIQVNADQGLANAFVYLAKVPSNWQPTQEDLKPFTLTIQDYRFAPRVAIIRTGQDLRLNNSSDEADNFAFEPMKNGGQNRAVEAGSEITLKHPFTITERTPVQAKSHIHPWKAAFLLPLDHPFAAITDKQGRFSIEGLPPGEHSFLIWHERTGWLEKSFVVNIEAGQTTEVNRSYSVDRLRLAANLNPSNDTPIDILWGESVDGMRLGIRRSEFARRRSPLRHGEHIDYEVWIKNETDEIVQIARDPRDVHSPRLMDDQSINVVGWSTGMSFMIPPEELAKAELILLPGQAAHRFPMPNHSASIRPPGSPRGRYGSDPLLLEPGKYPVYAQFGELKSGVEVVEIIPEARLQIRKASRVTEKKREYAAEDPSEAILAWQSGDGEKHEAMVNWDHGIFVDERDLVSMEIVPVDGEHDQYSILLRLRPESATWLARQIKMYSLWDDPDLVAILLDGKPLMAPRLDASKPISQIMIDGKLSQVAASSLVLTLQSLISKPIESKTTASDNNTQSSEEKADSSKQSFQLIDGETGTPLQGLKCRAIIAKRNTPPRYQACTTDEHGVAEVDVAKDESAGIAEVPSGWFSNGFGPVYVVARPDSEQQPQPNAEKKNDEPKLLKLWRGTEVDGRLLWPDKTPAAGVKLMAGVYINHQSWKEKLGMDLTHYSFDHGDWPNWSRTIVTNDDGKFRVTVPPKDARFWLRIGTTQLGFGPQINVGENEAVTQRLAKCVPLEIQYGGSSRSNMLIVHDIAENDDKVLHVGELRLETGVIVRGRVVDAQGKGLAKVHLTSTGPHGPHSGRSATSGEDGKFEFPAMAAGNITVHPDARLREDKANFIGEVVSRDVQAVFVDQSFMIPAAIVPHQITIRAVPHTEVTFEWVDRRADKTQPIAFYGAFRVSGYMPDENGKPATYWTSETERVERDGKQWLTVKIPTQLLKPDLMLAADSKVTASYSDSTGVTSGPGIVELGDITANTTRTIFGDEPREPEDSRDGPQPARNDQSSWTPARPLKVTVSGGGSAKIVDDLSVRLEGDVQWQEASLQFVFDKPTNVQEIRLEILPVDSPTGPQFGRGGEELMFDVKPGIENQTGKFTSLDFASCTYLQNPSDDTTINCIDYLSDTGWKVPPLPADETAHELVLRFEKPVALRADQRLTLTVDSGGAKELAILNRIRVAFRHAVVIRTAEAATMEMRFVDDGEVPETKLINPGRGTERTLTAGERVEIAVAGAEFAYRWCPAGKFQMGASEDARKEYGDRFVPQHDVRISTGFWMQETEVTQLQYEKVMGQRPAFWQVSLQSDDISQHPVEQISWFDAKEFCERLSKLDVANDYRLPTEAEWEYACRAGTTTARYGDLKNIAWTFQTTDEGEGSSGHRHVGKKKPNAWGLYDMLGNVGEWCSDWYGPPPLQFTTDPAGPEFGESRVVRGDDCFADCSEGFPGCLAGARASWQPHDRSRIIGFRVVRMPIIASWDKGT